MDYQQAWEAMNNLEMCISKVCSAREILDCAIDKSVDGEKEKAETLMLAADEFLLMFIKEFDEKFKVAWNEVIVKQKEENLNQQYAEPEYLSYQGAVEAGWTMTDDGHWIPPEKTDIDYLANDFLTKDRTSNFPNENKTKNWVLPVEADPSGEYFLTFPDDLLEAAGLEEGDEIKWFDSGDGSYVLKKAATPETGTPTTPEATNIL
jgi:hypothetical protein